MLLVIPHDKISFRTRERMELLWYVKVVNKNCLKGGVKEIFNSGVDGWEIEHKSINNDMILPT